MHACSSRACSSRAGMHAGPVNIHENVLRAMDRPSQNHRDPWFPEFFKGILEDTKMIFGTTEASTSPALLIGS